MSNFFILLNKINIANRLLYYISQTKITIKSSLGLCFPLDAFSYIKRNPMFISRAMLYIFNNLTIYNIYTFFINILRYIYNNRGLFNYRFLLSEYLSFISYINFCFNNNILISLHDYRVYNNLLSNVSVIVEQFEELQRQRLELLIRYRNFIITPYLLVVGNRIGFDNDVPVLTFEATRHLLALRGALNIERDLRVITSIYTALLSPDSDHYEFDFTDLINIERNLSTINPQYIQNWDRLHLEGRFLTILTCRQSRSTTHNPDEFVRLEVYSDGTVTFVYF